MCAMTKQTIRERLEAIQRGTNNAQEMRVHIQMRRLVDAILQDVESASDEPRDESSNEDRGILENLTRWGVRGDATRQPIAIDPRTTAIALAGGGTRGSFQTGALLYLENVWQSFDPVLVVGTSTGALNALVVSEMGSGAGEKLCRIYTALRNREDLFDRPAWWEPVRDALNDVLGIDINTLGRGGRGDREFIETEDAQLAQNVVRFGPFAAAALAVALPQFFSVFAAGFTNWLAYRIDEEFGDLEELADRINEAYLLWRDSAQSIHTLEPLRAIIENQVSFDDVGRIPLRMCLAALQRGEIAYATDGGELLFGSAVRETANPIWQLSDFDSNPVLDCTIASASIPGVFPPVTLRQSPAGGDYFVDGGTREMIPAKAAAEFSPEQIVGILASSPKTTPINYTTRDFSGNEIPDRPHILEIPPRAIDMMLDEIARDDIYPSGGWGDDIERIFIHPLRNVHSSLDVEPGLIRINISYGYMRAFLTYRGAKGLLQGNAASMIFYIERIVASRLESWRLEREAYRLQYDPGLGEVVPTPVFDRSRLISIRQHKYRIAEDVDLLVAEAGDDVTSVPSSIPSEFGPEPIQNWWLGWENRFLISESIDPWAPHAVSDGGREFSYEDPGQIGEPPTSEFFPSA